jgi:3-deoxy-D-manno-octulosonic-acid transferase
MNKWIYNFTVGVIPIALQLAALFNTKAKKMVLGRKELFDRLRTSFSDQSFNKIWFHCASLGEFEQAKPIIERIKKVFPEYKILITFYSPSGYEPAQSYHAADYIHYLPFDSKQNAARFLDIVKPDLIIFIKYEFWFHYLEAIKKRKIPFFSASSIFRPDQKFFTHPKSLFRKMLDAFTYFFVQNESSRDLLQKAGLNNVLVTGDTRCDRVIEIAQNPKTFPEIEPFILNQFIWMIGSSWPDDMEVLNPVINSLPENVKVIIAPHELGTQKLNALEEGLKKNYIRYSEYVKNPDAHRNKKILIIDNIGMLSSLYQYADLAYVGGAFKDGLHNILEPAVYGIPVCFGRSKLNSKYQESLDLMALGGAFDISTPNEMQQLFDKSLHDKAFKSTAGNINKSYIHKNEGAADKIVMKVKELVS